MKSKINIKSLVLGALLGIAIVLSIGAAADSRTAWEYRVVVGKVFGAERDDGLDAAVNKAVSERWEFVSANHSTERYGFAVMRREKQ
jgi:hypothetical protein